MGVFSLPTETKAGSSPRKNVPTNATMYLATKLSNYLDIISLAHPKGERNGQYT